MTLEASLLAILATLVAAMIWVVKSLMTRSDRILESRDTQIARAFDQLAKSIAAFSRVEEREDEIHSALLLRMKSLSIEHDGMIERLEVLATVQKQLVTLVDRVLTSVNKL